MHAPHSQQIKLLNLQDFDTQIARLETRLGALPQFEQQRETQALANDLKTKSVQVSGLQTKYNRQQTKLDEELSSLRDRYSRQQTRLHSGQGSPKELLSLQSEIAQMENRIKKLEDQQLQLLAELEKLESISNKIADRQAEYQQRLTQLDQSIAEETGNLNQKLNALKQQRQKLGAQIDPDLLELYDEIRGRTGGVGAVKLVGVQAVDYELYFSAVETAQIRQAPLEQVICSEEYDYILVRCPQ